GRCRRSRAVRQRGGVPLIDHVDAAFRAGEGWNLTVGDGERLEAEFLEGRAEGMHATVARGEGVIRGQHGAFVAAGEVNGAGIAGSDVVEGVNCRDREGVGVPFDGGQGVTGHDELDGGRRVDLDAAPSAAEAAGRRVGGGEGPRAGCLQRGGEGVYAVV